MFFTTNDKTLFLVVYKYPIHESFLIIERQYTDTFCYTVREKKICNRENLKIHYTLTNKTLSGVFWPFSCCKEKKASDKLSLTN